LDDTANHDFLRSLSRGQTPRELLEDAGADKGNLVVGLVDKRSEDYVETFRSFSGSGQTLGGTTESNAASDASSPDVYDTAMLRSEVVAPTVDASQPTTSIQVRFPAGTRRVITLNLTQTVADLATLAAADGANTDLPAQFQLVAGFPPQPLTNPTATILEAGLKGAQVSLKKFG
jgi:UBX domain-containing protein 1